MKLELIIKLLLKLNKLFGLIIIFFWLFAPLHATQTGEEIELRLVPEDHIEEYLKDDAFDYARTYEAPMSVWDWIKYWIWKYLQAPVDTGGFYFWELLKYGLMIFAVVAVVYYLVKSGKVSLFSRNNPGYSSAISYSGEHISEVDFIQLMEEAVARGNYRMAVRYLYLNALKELAEKNLIQWKADKTNFHYYHELRSTKLAPLFREITRLFDYSWYGKADLSNSTFSEIKSSFDKFNQNLWQQQ